jgi:hypothetical protein
LEYREVSRSVDVPKNTGVEGFIQTVRTILKRPRVQEVKIGADGKVTYRRLVKDGVEENPLSIDLDSLTPHAVLGRASTVEELQEQPPSAAIAISMMFDRFAIDQVYPILWGTGADTVLWKWFGATTKSPLHSRSHLFGLSVVTDRQIPDTALLLFGATSPGAALIDTTNVLKLEMGVSIFRPPETTVEVI